MDTKLKKIVLMSEEAQRLLLRESNSGSTEMLDPLKSQKHTTLQFVKTVHNQASNGKLLPIALDKMAAMDKSMDELSVEDRAPAFQCVAGYKVCKAEASSTEDKVLCGVALAICFAKEIIPLA